MIGQIMLAAAAATSFNLTCTGEVLTKLKKELPSREPRQVDVRVDLRSNKYCIADCASTIAIKKVTDEEILFQDNPADSEGQNQRFVWRVNRYTGKSSAYLKLKDGTDVLEEGFCTRSPFTGFKQMRVRKF